MAETNNNLSKNNILKMIKSKYIVIRIFENLKQFKLLDIIHYNKKYQKLMNIKLKDYKNEFLKIEIEVIPKENVYGKFINFLDENIHIYFNDNNEEIKTKAITTDNRVEKIKIILNHKIKSLSELFYCCRCIKKINFIKFKRDDIKDMSYMFYDCSSMEDLNLSNFNTNNVINMNYIFHGCSSLKELNLSNFNTNNVKNMSGMFYECSSLKELNLSNFNTNNVIYMSHMFYWCSSLKTLNLSNFNTINVADMSYMFYECLSLKALNLSNFNTINVTDMSYFLYGCSSLISLICEDNSILKVYSK